MNIVRATNPLEKVDNNSCTVVALSKVCNIEYKEAFNIAKAAGRKDGKGFYSDKLLKHAKVKHRLAFNKVVDDCLIPTRECQTLKQFVNSNPKGRFFVVKKGHAFSVINGVVVDNCLSGPKTRVIQAWKFKDHNMITQQQQQEEVVVAPTPSVAEPSVPSVVAFDRELFIKEWYATGKPSCRKIPCTKTGRMVTMFSSNLTNRVKKFGSVEALLDGFVSRGA